MYDMVNYNDLSLEMRDKVNSVLNSYSTCYLLLTKGGVIATPDVYMTKKETQDLILGVFTK